jgi:hypothetical protein
MRGWGLARVEERRMNGGGGRIVVDLTAKNPNKKSNKNKGRRRKEKTTLLSNLHFICNSLLTLKSDNYLLRLHNTFGLQHFLLTWTENVSIKWPTHDLNCPMRCKFEGLSIVSQYRS